MTPTAFYDTAGSVKHVVNQGNKETGAIASEHAAAGVRRDGVGIGNLGQSRQLHQVLPDPSE